MKIDYRGVSMECRIQSVKKTLSRFLKTTVIALSMLGTQVLAVDNYAREQELRDTDDYLIADAIHRRYGTRCKITLVNIEKGKVGCYAELNNKDLKWKSSGKRRTEMVYAETFIDAEIAVSKLMRSGIELTDPEKLKP